jgi:hypothetical protein
MEEFNNMRGAYQVLKIIALKLSTELTSPRSEGRKEK